MSRTSLVACACLLALLASRAAFASGDFWTEDKRLDQKVTCKLRHKTVSSVLACLQGLTGVKLTAGYRETDWQVRDRKMDIFARDLKLGDLMQSIARVMKFKWERTGEPGKRRYRLFMDRKVFLESEARLWRREEEFRKKQTERRTALLDRLAGLAKASPQDLARLKDESPFVHALATSGVGGALDRLFAQSPAARDAFLDKQEFALCGGDLPAAGQQAALALLRGIHGISSPFRGSSEPLPEDIADRVGSLNITINPEDSSSDADSFGASFFQRFMLGQVTVAYTRPREGASNVSDTEEIELPIMDPESGLGKALGKAMADPASMRSSDGTSASFSFKLEPKEFEERDFGEPQVKHPDDKEPKTEIDLAAKTAKPGASEQHFETVEDLFEAISEASGMSLVADCYGKTELRLQQSSKIPLRGALDTISMCLARNWWTYGSTIELRDRYWFRKRSLQIPEAWLEKWRATFTKTGTLEIDDLAEMAKLAGESAKYAANIGRDEVLGCWSVSSAVRGSRTFLQFYASLDADQRAAVFTESGLNAEALTDAQWRLARQHCASWTPESGLVLTASRKAGKFYPVDYSFKACTADGAETHWTINSPKYVPPKKAESGGK